MSKIQKLKPVAILSMDQLDDFQNYDELLHEPLAKLGWKIQTISWRNNNIDWNQFAAVLIRSPWDYQDDPELFLQVLEKIERSSAYLENPLQLVKWNIQKTYLTDLMEAGLPIVPTVWGQQLKTSDIAHYFHQLQTNEIIIKPIISANADNTFRLTMDLAENLKTELTTTFKTRKFMVQPFIHSVITEGEFSLFFFAGEYSHAILKTPKPNDFRVQEEHGGSLRTILPEAHLLKLAKEASQFFSPEPLYSRLDFVRIGDSFAIMEIELIEPSLYFNMDKESPVRFSQAFDKWMSDKEARGV